MNSIAYSAVVLDEKSRERLIEKFKAQIPEGWLIIADHMTINLGEIDPEYEKYLELPMQIKLSVNEIAMDDMVVAVSVTGFDSKTPKPHITLAVNKQGGGKPSMSNKLNNWEKLKRPFYVTGKVKEVEYK